MDRPFEATPSIPRQSHRPRDSKEGGFLNTIRNMSGWVRTAVAAIGLLVVDGCAHAPKPVPPSQVQTERQICIVSEAQRGFPENSRPFIIAGLERYLREQYTNITVRDLGAPRTNSVYRVSACDDIIRFWFAAEKQVYLRTRIRISNVDTKIIEADTDRIDPDIFEDVLLKDYHPDQLSPLQVGQFEEALFGAIQDVYSKIPKGDKPIPLSDADRIKQIGNRYLSRFGTTKNAEAVRVMVNDVTERPLRLAEAERRRAATFERSKEKLIELRSKLRAADDAEDAGDYQHAYSFFDDARNSWLQVNAAYQDAQISLTREIEEMGRDVISGIQRNAGRIGIVRPAARPAEGPSAAFSAGWEMLRDQFIAELPNVGIVTTKIIEVGEKLHEDLARRGVTAELEVKFVHRESHSSERLEDMEVTVTQKSPSYYSRTFKTSKGDLLTEGGRAMFYLVPGTYEISCARCKEPHTMEVRSGKSSLTLEMY